MSKNEKLISKVAKLLELASNNPNPSESELALRKAHSIMEQNNLSIAQVQESENGNAKIKFEITMETSHGYSGKLKDVRQYFQWLSTVVADVTETKPVFSQRVVPIKYRGVTTNRFKTFTCFVGEITDAAVAAAMYQSFVQQIHKACKTYIGPGYGKKQRSFCEGYVQGMMMALLILKSERCTETALVRTQKRDAIDEEMADFNPMPKKIAKLRDDESSALGFALGRKTDLGRDNRLEESNGENQLLNS